MPLKVTPVGKFRPKHEEHPVEAYLRQQREQKPKPTYREYLYAECLKRKLTADEVLENAIALSVDEEAWYYDDHKVPLCGEFGICIIRNGAITQTFPEGNY